tara:strand:- start:93 stop:308 length:216 start_codon:yes stop_codon:yes gene_type:complete
MKKKSRKKKSRSELAMKRKRMLSSKKAERKWIGDTSKGSAGFVEYYKPKGTAPKLNSKPLRGGSPGLGKKK